MIIVFGLNITNSFIYYRGVESQSFYLMHISLLREYLDLEFSALRDLLPFDYDFERIIDDFVLLALFIGNDFVPHLPKLHIAEGALGLMFKVYKRILPEAGMTTCTLSEIFSIVHFLKAIHPSYRRVH